MLRSILVSLEALLAPDEATKAYERTAAEHARVALGQIEGRVAAAERTAAEARQARIAAHQVHLARIHYLSPAEREFLEGSHAGRH
jgi:hypothetical protein